MFACLLVCVVVFCCVVHLLASFVCSSCGEYDALYCGVCVIVCLCLVWFACACLLVCFVLVYVVLICLFACLFVLWCVLFGLRCLLC